MKTEEYSSSHFNLINSYKKYLSGKKVFVFCCNIRDCENVAKALRQGGIPADTLHSRMSCRAEQDYALSGIKSGEIKALCVTSSRILKTRCLAKADGLIVLSRTSSYSRHISMYEQLDCRGEVLDFTDNFYRFGKPDSFFGNVFSIQI